MIITIMILLLANVMAENSAYARGYRHGGHSEHVGIGVWLGPGWGPGWWGAPYYPYNNYPYYQEPPIVIQQQPDVFIQPTPQEQLPTYWYFCKESQGYYPYVKQCPGGWMKVVPTPPPNFSPPE
jgi:hypothetical protein